MSSRPRSAGARPGSAAPAGARPASGGPRRPASAGGRLSDVDGRPGSAATRKSRPSTANGRASVRGEDEDEDEGGEAPHRRTRRERIEERLEMKRERKEEKARIKATKPKLHANWYMRGRALWMMFSMSYYVKIVLALGIIMVLVAIILIATSASTEDDLKDADAVIAVLFVIGVFFIVISILAIRSRRREKNKRRRLGYDKKTGRYGEGSTATNGTVRTISERLDDTPRGHIDGIPLDDDTRFSEPKPPKQTFTAVKADEETGFTNLSVMIESDQLPGTPYRERRKESIQASLTSLSSGQILASASMRDDPDILVVPRPRETELTPTKFSGGKNVKKSKSPAASPRKDALDDIPELAVPSSGQSNSSPHLTPSISIIDTDETDDAVKPPGGSGSSRRKKKKRDYSNEAFENTP